MYGQENSPCPPTGCNLIGNSNIIHESCQYGPDNDWDWVSFPFGNGDDIEPMCPNFPCWELLFGHPTYTNNLGVLSPEAPTGSGVFRLAAEEWPGKNACSDAVMTPVTLSSGSYILSHVGKALGGSSGAENVSIDVWLLLFSSTTPTTDCNFVFHPPTSSHTVIPLNGHIEAWNKEFTCFSINTTFDRLGIVPHSHLASSLNLDQVQLIRDELTDMEDIEVTKCIGESLTMGLPDLCTLDDLYFVWQKSTEENPDPNDPAVWEDLPEFDEMSEINITVTENATYRLCRKIGEAPNNYTISGIANCNCHTVTIKAIPSEGTACCIEFNEDKYDPINFIFPFNQSVVWDNNNNPWTGTQTVALGTVRLNEDLLIPSSVDLTINDMNFEFGPEGRIIVQPGASLILNDCVLEGDPVCETMWQGIRVLGPGNGVAANAKNAGQLFINNGSIKHAISGAAGTLFSDAPFDFSNILSDVIYDPLPVPEINPFKDTKLRNLKQFFGQTARDNTGGAINVDGTTFTDCFHGIDIWWHRSTTGLKSRVVNANFETASSTTNLRFPLELTQSEAGFVAYYSVGILNTSVENSTFTNTKYGIASNKFDQQGFRNNQFYHCEIGISARNHFGFVGEPGDLSRPNHILLNCFEHCTTAIECENISVNIQYNQISTGVFKFTTGGHIGLGQLCNTEPNTNYEFNSLLDPTFGILMNGCVFNVINNLIGGSTFGVLLENNIDPLVDGTGASLYQWLIDEREFTFGIIFSYVKENIFNQNLVGTFARNGNTNVQIRCNDYSNFLLTGILVNGPTGTSVLVDQGACTTLSGPTDSGGPAMNLFNFAGNSPLLTDIFIGNPAIFSFDFNLDIANFPYISINDPLFVNECSFGNGGKEQVCKPGDIEPGGGIAYPGDNPQIIYTDYILNDIMGVDTSSFNHHSEIRGKKEQEEKTEISLQPNPSTGILYVSSTTYAKLIIYNLNGQELFTYNITKGYNQLNLSVFPKGLYFYRLNTYNKTIKNGKLILID